MAASNTLSRSKNAPRTTTGMHHFLRNGDPFIWLTGGTLAFSLLMISGLIWIVGANALGFFWPAKIQQVELQNNEKILAAVRAKEPIPLTREQFRTQYQVANRDLYGADFRWIDDASIKSQTYPLNTIYLERYEWGPFLGFLTGIRRDGTLITEPFERLWATFVELHGVTQGTLAAIRNIEKGDIGDINYELEQLRVAIKKAERQGANDTEKIERVQSLHLEMRTLQKAYEEKEEELLTLYRENARYELVVQDVNGIKRELPIAGVVRGFLPNNMTQIERLGLYLARFWEFFWEDPREANMEGGVFPAIFGTVMMVIIMTIIVVPFGVIAALYLREYAKQGPLVRSVRIAVNNLAGVPSIVFGVFGLGFFVYTVGGSIDQFFFQDSLPTPTYGTGGILWASLTLALMTVPVVIVSTEESLAAIPSEWREGSLALGATKWETLRKIVIPGALPGILTGTILAMARGAGEVAPLMITGVVKLAPTLPVDGHWPFFHLERKFMHLGFHIYDVGFQSPNVEAAKPMVFMTTLLLIIIVVALNLTAIAIRNRLRSRLRFGAF